MPFQSVKSEYTRKSSAEYSAMYSWRTETAHEKSPNQVARQRTYFFIKHTHLHIAHLFIVHIQIASTYLPYKALFVYQCFAVHATECICPQAYLNIERAWHEQRSAQPSN